MSLSTQPYKGARDFYPEDKRIQDYMFGRMRQVAERFGYEAYDAPILEPLELYAAKSGEEIVNEQTYIFEDRGGRQVAIRPEMTPTVSRMVAGQRQELAYPLRWYSIPNLWRYERPQRGRLREHWQLNVDIFGISGLAAEHEIMLLADQLMKAYGATHDMYSFRINSRVLMDYCIRDYLGMDEVQHQTLAKLIDRIHKISPEEFSSQADGIMTPHQREIGMVEKLESLMQAKRLGDLPPEIQQHAACQKVAQLLKLLDDSRVSNAQFDITIMRGLDYYTDIVFEVFDQNPENNRSMFGGGRYDGLVSLFGVEPVPTVGFGMGDVTLRNFLETHGLLPDLPPETDVYVALAGDDVYEKAQSLLARMRDMGLNVAVDTTGRKLDKQLKTADKKHIRYVLVLGDNELESGQFTLRNLQDGQEETHSLERIVSIIKDRRHATRTVDED